MDFQIFSADTVENTRSTFTLPLVYGAGDDLRFGKYFFFFDLKNTFYRIHELAHPKQIEAIPIFHLTSR